SPVEPAAQKIDEERPAPARVAPTQNATPAKSTGVETSSEVPGILHQVLPDVPQSARNTITGMVRDGVRVQVDGSGNVVGSSLESPGPSKYFAKLAQQAAQEWKFEPTGGAGDWVLNFAFGRTGTEVKPVRK